MFETTETVGERLQAARSALGKSLEDLYEETRINVTHLGLMEENHFDFLPETYVRSFLKVYATSLGLDPGEVLAAYSNETGTPAPAAVEEAATSATVQLVSASPDTPATGRGDLVEAKESGSSGTTSSAGALEWALGFGVLLLLVGLVTGYMLYKAEIAAHAPLADDAAGLTPAMLIPFDGEQGMFQVSQCITRTQNSLDLA